MSKASLLQLASSGEYDKFIYSGKPDINRFLTVFNAGSNYASQPVEILLDGSQTFGGNLHFTLDHSLGDLVNKLYLRINLPIIEPDKDISKDNGADFYCSWVKKVGLRIIEKVSISFNGKTIVEHTGEYMNAKGNVSIEPNAYINMINVSKAQASNDGNSCLPEQTLFVPLMFWFCDSYSNSLPLIAMSNVNIKIDLKLRNLDELLIIWENDENNNNVIKRDWCITRNKNLNIDCIANMVYLGTDERALISRSVLELK